MRVLFLTVCLELARARGEVDQQTCHFPDIVKCANKKKGDRQFIQFKKNRSLHELPSLAEDAVNRPVEAAAIADMRSSSNISGSEDDRSDSSGFGNIGLIPKIYNRTDSPVELSWTGQSKASDAPAMLHVVNGMNTEVEKDDCSFVTAPPCEQMVSHNCAKVGSLPKFCPKACSYVVVDLLYQCEAACVPATKCYEGGIRTTYDNPATHVCEESPIHGCRLHGPHGNGHLPQTCLECSDGFILQDGQCVFFQHVREVNMFVLICFAIFLVALLPLNLYRWCALPIGNPGAVNHGWSRQKDSVASMDNYGDSWNYLDPTLPMELYPLNTNMCKDQIAGPGFNLYYRSLLFLLIVALILAGATSFLYYLSGFRSAGLEGQEACQIGMLQLVTKKEPDSAEMYAYVFGVVWIVLLLCSLLHARSQHLSFRELRREHHLMSDFSTKVEGFPPDADEAEIKSFFNQVAPDTVAAVSLAYDYREHEDMVDQLLAKQHLDEEVAQGFVPMEADMDDPTDKDKEAIKKVLMSLKGSGIAFSVSDSKQNRNKFMDAFEAARPLFRGQWPLEMRRVKAEPTTFFWLNFPYSRKYHWVHGGKETFIVLLEASILAAVLFLPAAYFLYNWKKANGIESAHVDIDSNLIIMIMGLPLIALNAVLHMLVDRSCNRIGLYYKTDIDRCNLIGSTLIVGLATIFNLVLLLEAVKAANQDLDHNLFKNQPAPRRRLREESIDENISQQIYAMLVPGVLLLPDTLARFVKYSCTVKALFNYLVSLPFCKRDMRSNVDLTYLEAEEGLQATPMRIEFDYVSSICVFGTAFFILGFPGYYAVLTCWILVAWVVLSYGILTLCHLRFAKLIPYTSCCLDDCATYLWGIPVSLIAAVSVHWARKAWNWEMSLPYPEFAVTVAAFILYCVLITIVFECVSEFNVDCDVESNSDYASSASRLQYDYFNTNPVHVLKTLYVDGYGEPLLHHRIGEPLVYFQRGKEHLQTKFVKKDPSYKEFLTRVSQRL